MRVGRFGVLLKTAPSPGDRSDRPRRCDKNLQVRRTRRRPFLHGLRDRSIDMDVLIDPSDPGEGNPVMVAVLVFRQLDRVASVKVIDGGEFALHRAHDRHVVLDLGCIHADTFLVDARNAMVRLDFQTTGAVVTIPTAI